MRLGYCAGLGLDCARLGLELGAYVLNVGMVGVGSIRIHG